MAPGNSGTRKVEFLIGGPGLQRIELHCARYGVLNVGLRVKSLFRVAQVLECFKD